VPREVDLERVAGDRHLDRVAQHGAERVAQDLAVIRTIGDGADRGAHRALGAVLHDLGEGCQILDAVLVHEGDEALRADGVGGNQRMNVPEHLRRVAHVLGQQQEQVLARHAGAEQLHRRDLEAS
jgi:hypothetical protein